jgi:hypothetical protein
MKKTSLFIALLFACLIFQAQTNIRVVAPIAGVPSSNEYKVSVSTARNGAYSPSHVHFTREYWNGSNDDFRYNFYLEGYRMSYVNFEFANGEVWVQVEKPTGNIPDLEVRPVAKKTEIIYENDANGKRIAKIKIQAPTTDYFKTSYLSVVPKVAGNRAFDNGLGIFANPFVNAPTTNIVNVGPGDAIPQAVSLSAGQTVIFEPGNHNIGINYVVKSGVSYFLANGSVVTGTFNNGQSVNNVKIYGYGSLTSTGIKRFEGGEKLKHRSIDFSNSDNVIIEGITIVDPSHHTLILGDGEVTKNIVRKIKILGWRANGDGIHVTGKALVQDCFIRTQDDACYIASAMDGVTIERLVIWTDFNGSAFIFTAASPGKNVDVLNSDVVYNRSRFSRIDPGGANNNDWLGYDGGYVFNLRGLQNNAIVENITIDSIRVDDETLERALFHLVMVPNPGTSTNFKFRNIVFRNITAPYGGDYPNKILGHSSTSFPEGIKFECVRIGTNNANNLLTNLNGWSTNNLVNGQITFGTCTETALAIGDDGTGLKAEYFKNTTLDGTPFSTSIVDSVAYAMGLGGFNDNTDIDIFSLRFSGQVMPRYTETYNFHTLSDDGVRLWVNGVKIIDDFNIYAVKENTGTIQLEANKKYDIKLEYFENKANAQVKLFWSSARQAKQIIPRKRLYPSCLNCNTVPVGSNTKALALSPNPIEKGSNLTVGYVSDAATPAPAQLVVNDFSGKPVYSKNVTIVKGSNTFTIPTNNIIPGIYVINLIANNKKKVTSKLVIN